MPEIIKPIVNKVFMGKDQKSKKEVDISDTSILTGGKTENITNGKDGEVIHLTDGVKEYLDEMGFHSPKVEFNGDGQANIMFQRNALLSRVVGTAGRRDIGKNKARLRSDYSLEKAERLYEKEAIVRKYVSVATSKLMRGKFELVRNPNYDVGRSRGKELHDKIMERHDEIMMNSGMTWSQVIQTTGKELFTFGLSFILKRELNGKLHRLVHDDPLFYDMVVDTKNMERDYFVRRPFLRPKPHSEEMFDNAIKSFGFNSTILGSDLLQSEAFSLLGYDGGFGLRNTVGINKEERVAKDNMIFFQYMIEKNAPFPMSPIMAAAVDIEDLRTLEENLTLLGFQYGHPMLHVTVDTEGLGIEAAQREIDRAINAVESMLSNGFLTTTKRISIKLHYPEGSAIPLDKFVEYLHNRIGKALDTPSLFLGDGSDAGRQAGETIEATANDTIQALATIMAEILQRDYINRLHKDVGGTERVSPTILRVSEIDRNRHQTQVNNVLNLVSAHAATDDELRGTLGFTPLTEEQRAKILKRQQLAGGGSSSNANPENQFGPQTPGTTKD